jgi:H+-transporting ATPase
MPYMLELACVIALAVGDWADFGIILAMLLANGILGFHSN